jgi:hypothetical protein
MVAPRSTLLQKSFTVTRKWMKKVVAPSILLATLSKVIPISDRWYVRWRYHFTFGRPLDLANPQTFTAKLQWLKLNGHPEQYASLTDKFAVYEYVRRKAGEGHLVRLLGDYQDASDIPWDALPEKFVLKATHASGWNLIVPDKRQLDRQKAVETCRRWLTTSYVARRHEPVYREILPRIICVEYLGDPDTELFDYKLYCFNGRVRLIHVDTERFTRHQRTFYTPDWERLPFGYTYPVREEDVPRPAALKEMISLAERLAGSIPFVRVDLYYIRGQIYFGEMTFYPDGGFGAFTPPSWDATIGSYLVLPKAE